MENEGRRISEPGSSAKINRKANHKMIIKRNSFIRCREIPSEVSVNPATNHIHGGQNVIAAHESRCRAKQIVKITHNTPDNPKTVVFRIGRRRGFLSSS